MLLTAACSGSSGTESPAASRPATTSAAPSSSAAPSTSSAPSAPATPTPSRSAAALSRLENDPAVKAWRAFAVQAAKTVNTGHETSAALRRLMTKSFAATMHHILGPDVGLYYPGPVPFQPVSVTVTSPTARVVRGCLFQQGFTWKSKSAQRAAQRRFIGPAMVFTVRQNGRWIVDNVTAARNVNCKNVEVRTQRWDDVSD